MAKHTQARLGTLETVIIADTIRKHADLYNKDGRKMMRWHEGWSDSKIADAVAKEIGFVPRTTAVQRLRQKAIGYTESTGIANLSGKGPFAMRLAKLEDSLVSLGRSINAIRRHVGLPEDAGVANTYHEVEVIQGESTREEAESEDAFSVKI